jgi:ribosomal protein S17E
MGIENKDWYNKMTDDESQKVISVIASYINKMAESNKRLRQRITEMQDSTTYKKLEEENKTLREQQTHSVNFGLSQEQVDYGKQLFQEHIEQTHPDSGKSLMTPYHYEICLDGGGIFSNGKYVVCDKCKLKMEINKDERE